MNLSEQFSPFVRALVAAALAGGLLVLISWAGPVLVPILLAWYLAALSLPGYFWLQKRGVKSGLAMLVLVFLVFVIALAI